VVVSQAPHCVAAVRSLDLCCLGDLFEDELGPFFHNGESLAIPVSVFSAPYCVADLLSQLFMGLHMDWDQGSGLTCLKLLLFTWVFLSWKKFLFCLKLCWH